MTLYHGTNVDFNLIDIEKSNPYKDFGKGFYLTDIKEQAERMALRKVKFFGGVPVIQVYDFELSAEDMAVINGITPHAPRHDPDKIDF